MENQRPLILVSNDDGIIAKGISELIKFLRPLGEIVVMAPDAPRSGSACALTVTEPIHYQLVRKDVGLTVYKCSGTDRLCEAGFSYGARPQARLGGRRHQPRRQFFCKPALFRYDGRCDRGMPERSAFHRILPLQP